MNCCTRRQPKCVIIAPIRCRRPMRAFSTMRRTAPASHVAISCRGRKEFESFRLLSFRGSQVLALTEIGNGRPESRFRRDTGPACNERPDDPRPADPPLIDRERPFGLGPYWRCRNRAPPLACGPCPRAARMQVILGPVSASMRGRDGPMTLEHRFNRRAALDQFRLLSTSARCLIHGIISRSLAPTCSIGCSASLPRIALNDV
jgi:hypothetical protein